MKIFLRLAVALAWALAGAAAAQQDTCARIESTLGREPLKMVAFLDQASCLGDDNDRDATARGVRGVLADAGASEADRVDDALLQVTRYVRSAAGSRAGASQPLLATLAGEIESVRERLLARVPLGEQNVKGWEWRGAVLRGVPAVDASRLEITCAQASDAACQEAGETGKIVFRAASLVRQSLQLSMAPVYDKALAATRVRDAKWTRYFDEARLQFPWELWVNGLRYGRVNRKAGGFAEPPRDQIILAHPGVGMEYVRGAESGSRLEPALLIELIGYNRWRWTQDGTMENAWGASLVQTYSDRAGLSSARPGIMVHWQNKYSVAFTRNNGSTGILLSVDLAKAVARVEKDARERFRLSGRED